MQNPPTVGLKWTAADGSSPLAILLSKYSPEVAAKNANRTTALDCGSAEIFKEWVQANTNPSVSQQSKQVGSGKEPSQVEYTQTQETIEDESGARSVRETQQTHVRTDDGASVTLRRGMEDRACAALGCADDRAAASGVHADPGDHRGARREQRARDASDARVRKCQR